MIGLLTGTLLIRNDPFIILDVHGVGYKVCAAADILAKFHIGDTLTVFIHTHVREDALELFGFSDQASLRLFEMLVSVSGIGPKTAIGIFGLGEKEKIIGAIRNADVDFFTGVPRLGRKNAQKIIIELKNKIGSVADLDLQSDGETSDVVVALTGFGFSPEEAKMALREIGERGSTTSEKVRLALKYLGK
jgi:Holliday junction DNA helicase RuvA